VLGWAIGPALAVPAVDVLQHQQAAQAVAYLHSGVGTHAASPVESGTVHLTGAGLEAERVAERLLDRPALVFLRTSGATRGGAG
jgi:hypothetical protein